MTIRVAIVCVLNLVWSSTAFAAELPADVQQQLWRDVLDGYNREQETIRSIEMKYVYKSDWKLEGAKSTVRAISYARSGDKYIMEASSTFLRKDQKDHLVLAVTRLPAGAVRRFLRTCPSQRL